jgi:CHAD domain-containing protein
MTGLIGRFAEQCARCDTVAGPDEVHDLRVSVRRFDQGLRLFAEWLPQRRSDKIRACIKAIITAAGGVRDCDIALQLAAELGVELPPHTSVELRTRRGTASAYLRTKLRPVIDDQLPAKWRVQLELDGIDANSDGKFAALARKALPGEIGDFIERGSALAGHPTSKRALHAFRISAKRLRYSLEPFADLYGKDLGSRIAKVRRVQTVLGDLNDRVVSGRLLEELGAGDAIVHPFREAAEKKIEQFQMTWGELFGKQNTSDEWVYLLEQVPATAKRAATKRSPVRRRAKAAKTRPIRVA